MDQIKTFPDSQRREDIDIEVNTWLDQHEGRIEVKGVAYVLTVQGGLKVYGAMVHYRPLK